MFCSKKYKKLHIYAGLLIIAFKICLKLLTLVLWPYGKITDLWLLLLLLWISFTVPMCPTP